MNKIRAAYIDLGCYDGDSITQFFNWSKLLWDPKEFEIYAFDPNPRYWKQWEDLEEKHSNIQFSPKAAHDHNGTIQFSLYPIEKSFGSSVMKEKRDYQTGEESEVECFDLSAWIKKEFTDADILLIKMDIEGAEFPVLEKMIKDRAFTMVTHLFVEWHDTKMDHGFTERRIKIESFLNDRVHWSSWS